MPLNNTFIELGIKNAPKQRVIVDKFMEKTPFFSAMKMQPASAGFQNVYPEVTSVTGGDILDLNAVVPEVGADVKLEKKDLSKIAGKIRCKRDTALVLGNGDLIAGRNYFYSQQMPHILSQTIMSAELNIWKQVRQFAIDNGKYASAGGSNNVNYSMFAITFEEGINIGLYNPSLPTTQELFAIRDRNGGDTIDISVTGGTIEAYQRDFEMFFGLQLADARYVSSIVNIDPAASKIPTQKQISKMLVDARAGGSTIIVCHPDVKLELNAYKLSQLSLYNPDLGLNTVVDAWDNVPIITSYNIPSANEANVA